MKHKHKASRTLLTFIDRTIVDKAIYSLLWNLNYHFIRVIYFVCYEINVTFSLIHPSSTNECIWIYIMLAHHETSTVIGLASNGAPSVVFVSKQKYYHETNLRDPYETENIICAYQVAMSLPSLKMLECKTKEVFLQCATLKRVTLRVKIPIIPWRKPCLQTLYAKYVWATGPVLPNLPAPLHI